jgi:ABC-type branched-subunit amino acid transport system substrate-binding protein
MTTTRYHRFLRVLALLIGGLAFAPAQGQDLLVGQVASRTSVLTGPNARGLHLGMKTYFDHTNAQGGVNGRPVKILIGDDELNTGKMVALTNEFIANKEVLVLAGYLNTAGIVALSRQDIPGKAGIALVSPQAGDKAIFGAANFFPFRSGFPDEVVAIIKHASDTQKKKLAVVYWTVTFGPALAKQAEDLAKKAGLNVASVKVEEAATDKFDAAIGQAVAQVVKEAPDAILVVMASRYANEFIKQVKASGAGGAQVYALSLVGVADVVKAAGPNGARGVIVSQSLPFPFSATLPVVGEYQRLMKQYAPGEALSYSTLEGFMAGKIVVEGLRRAGPKPTREKVTKALNELGDFNLGGVYVNYLPNARLGWGGVDLTIIGENGKLLR